MLVIVMWQTEPECLRKGMYFASVMQIELNLLAVIDAKVGCFAVVGE